MKSSKLEAISLSLCLMCILQLSLYAINHLIFIFVERTNFSDCIATMTAMIIITVILVLITRKKNIGLSVFPQHMSKLYVLSTTVVVVIIILTPSNFTGDIKAILLLIYGSIITPIFEELIFRGYIWNKLSGAFESKWLVYILSSVLFGVWHMGYIDSIAFRVTSNLGTIMLWKCITGLCYGIILGLVRLKTKNCYSTMLLHGLMNVFGR